MKRRGDSDGAVEATDAKAAPAWSALHRIHPFTFGLIGALGVLVALLSAG